MTPGRGRSGPHALAAAAGIGLLAVLAAGGPAPASAASGECEPGEVVLAPERPWALDALQADGAWRRATGAGVLVAVVDSGVDAGNPHLAAAVVGGVDLVGDGERSDGLSDLDGHGTAIAGQIAARSVEGSGVVGLAPEASILSVRVFRSTDQRSVEEGFGPSAERLAEGIRYAAEHGAQVVNVSLSDVDDTPALRGAVAAAHAAGSLVVASAGNRGTAQEPSDGPRFPAAYDGVLGVAASDADGVVDDASIHGPQVDVAAPGREVLSSATGAGDCRYAVEAASTSFATGYASGAAALLAEAHPGEGPDGWSYRLTASALRTDPDTRDEVRGWGLVRPASAIALLADGSARGPALPGTDDRGPAVRPAAVQLTPDHRPPAMQRTLELAGLAAVPAAALLGVLGTVVVLRRRRGEAAEERSGDTRDEGSSAADPVAEP